MGESLKKKFQWLTATNCLESKTTKTANILDMTVTVIESFEHKEVMKTMYTTGIRMIKRRKRIKTFACQTDILVLNNLTHIEHMHAIKKSSYVQMEHHFQHRGTMVPRKTSNI